jgi:Ca2+:H+ antiporter
LGLSFLAGGWKYREQTFNRTAASVSATALSLAAVALVLPTVFHLVAAPTDARWQAKEQDMSLAIAVVLFLTYAASLLFSLKTHKELFVGGSHGVADEEDEANHESWSRGKSIGVLLVATAFVALISEFLVGAVENARASLGLTEVFVGVIVCAIIGNAAEHSSAILMAMRNKMDLALGIAVGSSLQIALFVAPVLVFASYAFGRPMNLEFTIPEVVAVVGAIFILGQISQDGESNWLEGVQLLCLYAILGILFYFLPEAHHAAEATPGAGMAPAPAH